MSLEGLPTGLQMRHDAHYVEELSQHRPQQVGRMIAVDKLDPNPEQPRTEFGDLTELTASIAEKGVLEPPRQTKSTHRALDDHRRRASLALGAEGGTQGSSVSRWKSTTARSRRLR